MRGGCRARFVSWIASFIPIKRRVRSIAKTCRTVRTLASWQLQTSKGDKETPKWKCKRKRSLARTANSPRITRAYIICEYRPFTAVYPVQEDFLMRLYELFENDIHNAASTYTYFIYRNIFLLSVIFFYTYRNKLSINRLWDLIVVCGLRNLCPVGPAAFV